MTTPTRNQSERHLETVPSRREFLKGVAFATLGSAAISPLQRISLRPSCIVIGAGLSGLAAARKLAQNGWTVTIVEARNRPGGRVWSYRFQQDQNLVCELGAEWIGGSHQRLIEMAREFDLKLLDHRFAASLCQDGKVSRPGSWSFSQPAIQAFERFRQEYENYSEGDKKRLDSYDWWTWLENLGYGQDDLLIRDLMDSTDFGESIRHVSAYAAAAEYFESSPENEMDYKIEGGNSRLVEALAARIETKNIRLGLPVTRIQQREGRVTVTAGTETFTGDACICTVPTRVLDRIEFDPPLSAEYQAAAEQLQYSRIIKNSVLFKKRFWDAENFSLVSDGTSHYYFHQTKNQPGKGGILCSYAVGEKADVLAAQDDRRRMQIISEELRPVAKSAPKLAQAIASYAWQRDRYTHGAYAMYRPGQWFTIRPTLKQPHGKILFAGEHLADWQGFMEGAVNTGEEAAEMLTGD